MCILSVYGIYFCMCTEFIFVCVCVCVFGDAFYYFSTGVYQFIDHIERTQGRKACSVDLCSCAGVTGIIYSLMIMPIMRLPGRTEVSEVS